LNVPTKIKNLPSKSKEIILSNPMVAVSIAIYTIAFSSITIIRHNTYGSHAWDLGIFDQSLWSTLNYGRLLWNTPELGSHFGFHFQPILFVILPVYAICQSPLTLLIIQSLVIGLGAIPVYWLAKDELGKFAGTFFAMLYLLYPALHGVNWFEFHPEAFVPILLLLSFYYLKRGRWTAYFPFLFLALMCKETVSVVVVSLGLYFLYLRRKTIMKLLRREKSDRKNTSEVIIAIITIFLGVLWFIVALTVISHFNPQGYVFIDAYSRFGEDFPSIIFNILRNPVYALEVAFTPLNAKLAFLVALFAPLAFLSFLDAPSLSISFPYLAILLLSSKTPQYQIGFQYPAPLIPFIFVSAIYGVKHLVRRKNAANHSFVRKPLFLMALCSSILLCSQVFYVWAPFMRGLAPITLPHQEALNLGISMIPPYASVSTQGNIFPHVSHRLSAYPFFERGTEYILVDSLHGNYWLPIPLEPKSLKTALPDLVKNDTYGIMVAVDGIWLLKMNYTDEQVDLPFKNGLKAKFYNNLNVSGETIFEETLFKLDRTWDQYSLFAKVNENFSIRFEGYIHSAESGNYVFQLEGDGTTRLYIEQQLIFGWKPQSQTSLKPVFLEEGYHKIAIEYVKSGIPATLKLYWKPPWTNSMEIVPTEYLYLSPL
jgi:uncharacterized membrane protein